MQRPSQSGGSSIKEELQAIEKITGQKQKELDYPVMPPEFSSAFSTFSKISDITDSGILSYCQLMGVKIPPDEIEIIKDISYVKSAISCGKKPEQIQELFGWLS